MPGVTVALLGKKDALSLAGELGKGDVEGDVGRHFFRRDENSVNLVTPAKHPERVQGVSQALLVADHALLLVDAVDRDLGTLILAAAASGIGSGWIVVAKEELVEAVRPLLADTPLASWPVVTGEKAQPALLREALLELPQGGRPGPTRVAVEQAFPVKGLGTVILGVVVQGEVKKNQKLEHFPVGQTATVRSIQVHSHDVDVATGGQRVGLALRGVEPESFSRGHVLGEPGVVTTHEAGATLTWDVAVPRFHTPGLKGERALHVGAGLQFLTVRTDASSAVAAGESGSVRVQLESPLVAAKEDRFLLWDLNHEGLRLVGSASWPGTDGGGGS